MLTRFPATIRRLRRASALAVAISVGASGVGRAAQTTTPIRHLVVIFQENVSFDHYFGTYPNAVNPTGEPGFSPAPGTPVPNGLGFALLNANP
ncbi:MAG TPA: alkaline phosphatase family protein, partial [Thermoanaerobaculia bacterium]|nr:alkaline phosphatase family protein [Thermoanaerobaculia bacterium]